MFDQPPNTDEETLFTELEPPSTFIVTQHCLDEGKPRKQNKCMVAQCILKIGGQRPGVNKLGVVAFDWKGRRYVGSSKYLVERIYKFDRDGEVEPFIFHLENVKSFDLYEAEDRMSKLRYYRSLSEKNTPIWNEVCERHG